MTVPREQGNCCHWQLIGEGRQNEQILEAVGLLHIRNTSILVEGLGKGDCFVYKNIPFQNHMLLCLKMHFSVTILISC